MNKKLSLPVIIAIAAIAFFQFISQDELATSPSSTVQTDATGQSNQTVEQTRTRSTSTNRSTTTSAKSSNDALARAIAAKAEDVQVEGEGRVIKVLPDDNDGSRHQRFIVRVSPRQTVLIAHNIDLAPRVPSLKNGDTIAFYGEYVWNDKGGVIHWTHKDPANRHVAGWIKHNGKVYQ